MTDPLDPTERETIEVPANELLDLISAAMHEGAAVGDYMTRLAFANFQRMEEWHNAFGYTHGIDPPRSPKPPIVQVPFDE